MSNLIGLHFGQCGNQIGFDFWKALAQEHGLTPTGVLKERPDGKPREDNLFTFFTEGDHGRHVPRAVMVDLEPRVINTISQGEYSGFFLPTSKFMSDHGGGAGNNWANGYGQGKKVFDDVCEVIQREVERADNLEGFLLTHSVSGGTGSGLGSFFLERVRDHYPKAVIQTYSVFANQTGGASDVIVSPYNSVLTLDRLQREADAVVILDNTALHHVAGNHLKMEQNSFHHINYLVSRIMSTSTATIRFPSPLFSRLTTVVSHLVPYSPLRFLQTSMCPIVDPRDAVDFVGVTNVSGVMRQLLRPTNMMISTATKRNASPGCMLAGLAIMQGKVKNSDFKHCLTSGAVAMREMIRRPPWMSYNPLQLGKAPKSPFVETSVNVSGLLLSNHTSSVRLLQHTLSQYEGMRKRNAFIDRFQKEEGFTLDMMDESAEAVSDLVAEYGRIEHQEYFDQ